MRKIEEDDFNFGYFITLSFYKQTKKTINSYLDNEHIKNVILDYFYPHTKPHNRIRLWFFVEQHESGCLHTHFLMEKIDGLNWLSGRNRKMTLNKTTLFNIISNNYYFSMWYNIHGIKNKLGKRSDYVGVSKTYDLLKWIDHDYKGFECNHSYEGITKVYIGIDPNLDNISVKLYPKFKDLNNPPSVNITVNDVPLNGWNNIIVNLNKNQHKEAKNKNNSWQPSLKIKI